VVGLRRCYHHLWKPLVKSAHCSQKFADSRTIIEREEVLVCFPSSDEEQVRLDKIGGQERR